MKNIRILFGVPTRFHIEIAMDEITGMENIGYTCDKFNYAAKNGFSSSIGRLLIIITNSLNLILKSYIFNPHIIYINSRLEKLGSTRDFITIFLFKIFYFKKVHFVIKSHGSDIDVIKNNNLFLKRMVFPFLKKNVAAWLFLSSEEKEKILAMNYFHVNSIYVTKNIVRQYQFNKSSLVRSELNIPEEYKIILFVGRIILEKGIYEVIDAYNEVVKKHKVKLIIIGDGIEFINIKQKIKDYKLQEDVITTGFIPELEVVKYYSNSDILVFPTFYPEGFPMALFNSVSAGLSIITTKIRAAADYLKEPDNCFWVEDRNYKNIVVALDKLLMDDSRIKEMSRNNKLLGINFNQESVSAELSLIIKKILK